MIIVLGKVQVREGMLDQAIAVSIEHVNRSRLEPGCVSHSVNLDAENRNVLVFVEEWDDRAALWQHFQVPASQAFVKTVGAMAAQRPSMQVFEATPVALP